MANKDALRAAVFKAVEDYCAADFGYSFDAKNPIVRLHEPTFSAGEINAALECLLSTYVTMGPKVRKFEEVFASTFGWTDGVMNNSGSSANLLAVAALANPATEDGLRPGDEVIVPALSWSTTVWPVIQCGLKPVIVDIDPATFNIDPNEIEKAIGPKTRAVMIVPVYGNPCAMDAIVEICKRRNLILIEDCCEALGAYYDGKAVGKFGRVGTFSFYFSHHLTTLEGGITVTDDFELAELMRILRAHGWVREVKDRERWLKKYPEFDPRFLFVNVGYNLRPTELQGAFGIHQMPKLEPYIKIRRDNVEHWNAALRRHARWLRECPGRDTAGSRSVWFGYPITVRPEAPFTRDALVEFLEGRGIGTRPIMAGNFRDQPAIRLFPHRVAGSLERAEHVMRQSFFIGNHHAISDADRAYVVTCVDEFMARWA